MSLPNGIFAVLAHIAVRPAKAGDVVLNPLAKVDALHAGSEGGEVIPFSRNVLVLIARPDLVGAFFAAVLFASRADRGFVEGRCVIVAGAIVAHFAPLSVEVTGREFG